MTHFRQRTEVYARHGTMFALALALSHGAPTRAFCQESPATMAPEADAGTASETTTAAPASELHEAASALPEATDVPSAATDPSASPAEPVAPDVEHAAPERPSSAEAVPSDASLDALAALSLEELLTTPTTVASTRALTVRESPGVITTITRDEMVASGARDLLDVLWQVPGVFGGVDVQGTLGVGMRGLWGHEGKILFLFNGHTLNEGSFLTTALGGRIPVELLERVEIIRGPGSARYGGYAELAVVNIVTVSAAPGTRRAYVSSNYGQMEHGLGRGNVSAALSSNGVLAEGLSLSLAAYINKSHLSDATYRDLFGGQFDMADGHRFRTSTFDLGVGYKGLEVRYLVEDYRARTRDGFDEISADSYDYRFLSHHVSAQYGYEATPKLVITPRFEHHRQLPFNVKITPQLPYSYYTPEERATFGLYAYDRLAERTSFSARADYEAFDFLSVSAGSEFRVDRAVERDYNPYIDDLSGESLYDPGSLSATFYNVAAFAEATTTNRWLNATAGARYEYHEQFGSAFVPRLALGKVIGDLHLKALAAQAFKSPGLENINLNRDIERERTTAFELEVGYRLLPELLLTANAFDLTVHKPIVYTYDTVTEREGYVNRRHTGSRGAEAVVRYETQRVRVVSSYAFYTARHKNAVPDYAVPQDRRALLAAPNHKLSLSANARLWKTLYGNVSTFLISKRYAQTSLDATGEAARIGSLAPALLANLFVEYRDLGTPGLALSAGAYNVTGQHFSYPQPYTGLHGALPAMAREYLVRLSYRFDGQPDANAL